jgi:uncharacterized protein
MRLLRRLSRTVVGVAVALLLCGPAVATVEIGTPPGAEAYPAALRERLARALAAKGKDYEPRTHHLNEDGSPKYTNRLILESSPYLLQHAHNPVNWYPWGDEAFERAKREKKPVFLSVGYSTCHWCHVMEQESFEDEEIAKYLNEHYIAIKVDRERRPDVDGVYMAAVQAMSQRGGWPMSVWLTPERKPFYGGTYFPPRDGERGARVGFLGLLELLNRMYHEEPDKVAAASTDIAARIERSMAAPAGTGLPTVKAVHSAFERFSASFDATYGGFGRAPKFPRTVQLEALLRYHRRTGDPQALDMVTRTLEAMAAGGIHDQIGGGFHRYSTDAQWLVPHFEKMLYDNALLAVAYLEAYQVTGRTDFAEVVRRILGYVEREMTSPGGAFYSATDADSEGHEGTFFVWTPAQIEQALPDPTQRRLAIAYYGITEAGNFEGKNILHTPRSLQDVAKELGIDPGRAPAMLEATRARLYEIRSKRVPPHTDRKILVAWNGLMISAFARAARILDQPAYAQAAGRAADFILTKMEHGKRLDRSYLDGNAGGAAYLDDYAFLIAGLLDLFEATFDGRWLREAVSLQSTLDAHFRDNENGAYFLTADDQEQLLAREKPSYDGAEPSGNSVAMLNLLRLYEFSTDDQYRRGAESAFRAFEPTIARRPTSVPRMLVAVDFWSDRAKQIIIVTPNDLAQAGPFLAELRKTFVPNHILCVTAEGVSQTALAQLVPLVADKKARGGRATAYVCEMQVCELPTNQPDVFAQQIARVEPLDREPLRAKEGAKGSPEQEN